MSLSDLQYMMARAREPQHVSATGSIYAQGKKCLASTLQLVAASGAAATAVFRKGGAAGTIVWSLSAAAGTTATSPFPSGLYSNDGLYVTITGAGATVEVTGVVDA